MRVRVALRFFFWTCRVFFFFGVFASLLSSVFSLRRPRTPLRLLLSAANGLSFAALKSPIASDFKKKKKAESPTDQRRHFFLRDKKLIHTLTRTNAHPTSRSAHSKLKRNTYTHTVTMGKINFETEVESTLSNQSAKCDKLKIKVSDSVEGVNLSAKFTVPVGVELSSKGTGANVSTAKVDLEASKDFWKIKLDGVDQNTTNIMDVLNVSVKEKVAAIDSTATVEWKAKGNAVKAVLEPPVFEGVKSKLEFDNSKKQLTLNASTKVDKIDVSLKADANVKTQTFKEGKLTLSYPLPEGVKGSLEASTNGSGKITLKRGNLSAKMPLKDFTSAPNLGDVKLEFNYSTDIASF